MAEEVGHAPKCIMGQYYNTLQSTRSFMLFGPLERRPQIRLSRISFFFYFDVCKCWTLNVILLHNCSYCLANAWWSMKTITTWVFLRSSPGVKSSPRVIDQSYTHRWIQLFRERLSYKQGKAYATMSNIIAGNGGFYDCLIEPHGISAWTKETAQTRAFMLSPSLLFNHPKPHLSKA